MSDDVRCSLPWVHATVTMDNRKRPCCRFSLKDAVEFNNMDEGFDWLRQNMLDNVPTKQCQVCYDEEASDGSSMRTSFRHMFPLNFDKLDNKFKELRYIEISLDNICNYECRMCSSLYSSKLYKRDVFLTDNKLLNQAHKSDVNRLDKIMNMDIDWTKLERIKLLGGEPFMSPSFTKFLQFIDDVAIPQNISLEIVTNCSTELSKENEELLLKFSKILIIGSIDGTPQISKYQRMNSHTERDILNLMDYEDRLTNSIIGLHPTFTILNFNLLEESMEWLSKYVTKDRINWGYDRGGFLSFMHAPDWYESWIKSKTKDNKVYEVLRNRKYNHVDWHHTLEYIKSCDKFYGTDLYDVNPELAEMIDKYAFSQDNGPKLDHCEWCRKDLWNEM